MRKGRTFKSDLEAREEIKALARFRAAIGGGRGRQRSVFTANEAERRIAYYQRQIARSGRIRRWMAATDQVKQAGRRRRCRFAFGDALGRFGPLHEQAS